MITLRPDQVALKSDIYRGWQSGKRNMLAVLATGGGKSVIMSDIILDRHQAGASQAVIAHRNELVSQMSMHVARRGIKHRIIGSASTISEATAAHREEFNGRSFINPDANTAVASIDTLNARAETLTKWCLGVHNWYLDECFPAGVMIQTPSGDKPIETIRVGDVVTAFDEITGVMKPRKVLRTFKNPAPNTMIDIETSDAHVQCTFGHPFWTDRGWVEAGNLENGENLLVHMHRMWRPVHINLSTSRLSLQARWAGVLSHQMRNDVPGSAQGTTCDKTTERKNLYRVRCDTSSQARKNMFQGMCFKNIIAYNGADEPKTCFRTNEAKQSDEATRITCENVGNIAKKETSPIRPRWEWESVTRTGMCLVRNVDTTRFCITTRYTNKSHHREGYPQLLQTRCSVGMVQNSDRSRWVVAQFIGATGSGCEERFRFDVSRVESVKVLKQTNNDGTTDSFVYNFEVDELNTYIANGVVVHNCHHGLRANKWGRGLDLFKNAYGLGVTATPQRADGYGLGSDYDGPFDDMVQGPSMRDLINLGALSDYEIAIPDSDFVIDDEDLAPSGDWSTKKMREASKKSHIVGDVVREYSRRSLGKKFICFATDVETANEMAANFNAAGVPCAAVSAKTPAATRNEMIRRFKNGKLLGLVNVDLFGEGFDVPAVEVVIMARPTASLAVYLQQFGRALRVFAGKLYGLVIDHVSNWKRHGFPDKPHAWSLARREKRAKKEKDPEEIDLTACKGCSRPYEACLPACPYCGHIPPLPDPIDRTPQKVDGDLVLLTREMIAAMQAATVLESPAAMADRVEAVAGPLAGKGALNRQIEKIQAQDRLKQAIAVWAGIQRWKGRSDSESYRRFWHATGMDVMSAQALNDRAAYEALAERVEGWCND